jgi:dolichol kinase
MKELLFLAVVLPMLFYYTRKRRFDIVYSAFLSALLCALLKYMVSASLSFYSAPPALEVMVLSTLSVFIPKLWPVTAIFFFSYILQPLAGVSGLLIGFGLGKWHKMRSKRIMMQTGELKRKIFHSFSGIVLFAFASLVPKFITMAVFVVLAVIFFFLRKFPKGFVRDKAEEFTRKGEWMGRGSFWYAIGSLLPVYLGQPWIILVLALSDGMSALIGRLFGYTTLTTKKSLEGSFSGFLIAWAISRHFYSPAIIPALLYLAAEFLAPIDDNLAIPIAMSMIYIF